MPTATANRKFVYGTHGMYILAELIRDIAELALFCIRDWSLELGARSQDRSNHEPGQHRATQPFFGKVCTDVAFFFLAIDMKPLCFLSSSNFGSTFRTP